MKKGLWLLQVTISLCFTYFLINGISSLMSPNFLLFVCLFVCLFTFGMRLGKTLQSLLKVYMLNRKNVAVF